MFYTSFNNHHRAIKKTFMQYKRAHAALIFRENPSKENTSIFDMIVPNVDHACKSLIYLIVFNRSSNRVTIYHPWYQKYLSLEV